MVNKLLLFVIINDCPNLVVYYVDRHSGGAFQTMQYARKSGKKIINLAEEDTF